MAAPALYWWHMQQDTSVRSGVERALQIVNFIPDPPGKRPPGALHDVDRDEDRVRLITNDFRLYIKCLPRGDDDVLTIIIVAGNSDAQTRGTMETVRDVMRSGNINDLLE